LKIPSYSFPREAEGYLAILLSKLSVCVCVCLWLKKISLCVLRDLCGEKNKIV
jgi:hypothetical protein